jgi:hypothetical protein
MNTSEFPITQGSHVGCRWHDIEYNKSNDDRVEAMNLHGGRVLVRTTQRDQEPATDEGTYSIATSTSMIHLNDAMVVKRWAPHVREPYFDEDEGRDVPGVIVLSIEYSLAPPTWTHLRSKDTDLLRREHGTERSTFRWFNADESMPRPTDEQVRAYVEGLPPPNEADSLRRELDKMRERYLDAEARVSEARGVREDEEEPWVWSDDDTAKQIDGFGNTMVVRITGGHLRALLNQRREDHAILSDGTLQGLALLEPRGWVVSNSAGSPGGVQWQADKGDMTAIATTPELLLRAIEMCSEDCPVVHIGADGRIQCECADDEGDEHSPYCPISRSNHASFTYAQEIGQV